MSRKILNRIVSILVALTLCLGTTLTAFAAEENTFVEGIGVVDEESGIMPTAVGAILYFKDDDFIPDSTIPIGTTEGNWDADFSALVYGNPSARYSVTMTAASGETQSITVSGDGVPVFFTSMTYAKAGTYKFFFRQLTGNRIKIHAEVKIFD